jgi:HK97 family phage portal protein
MDSMPEPMAGVIDCLSQFQVGGPVAVRNATDGATTGISRDAIEAWFKDIVLENSSPAGVRVTPANGLCYPPVYYAVQKVSGHLGMMSWRLKQRIGDRKSRDAIEHPAYRLMSYPNHLYTGSVFTETVTGHTIYRGNGRAWIERDSFMRPKRLLIMLPEQWKTVLVDGEKWHIGKLTIDPETGRTQDYRVPDRDVLHIMGFSRDGINGVDVLQLARDSIALGLAAERQQSKHFSRNAVPGLLLSAPKGEFRKDGSAKKWLGEFREMHEGLDNAGKTALLTNGISATPVSHTGRDSQTIESRQFQREEVALWWMLESMIGEGGQSYGSEEQRQLAYLKGLPGKIKKRWEEERDAKLLSEKEKDSGSHFHQMNAGSLLQADMQSTLNTLSTGIRSKIYSPNDAREILGLDGYEGGDAYENPFTSSNKNQPKPTDNKGDATDPNDEQASALRERLRSAYQSRLEDLWAVEASRVRAAAAKGDEQKFAAWLQKFYGSAEWPKTLARVWTDFGGKADDAAAIMKSHELEIAFADFAKIEEVLTEWQQQPAALAAALTEALE